MLNMTRNMFGTNSLSPFQGYSEIGIPEPRALPWASIPRPFGADKTLTFVRVLGMLGMKLVATMEWSRPRGTDSVTKVTGTVRSILHPKRTRGVRHRKTPRTDGWPTACGGEREKSKRVSPRADTHTNDDSVSPPPSAGRGRGFRPTNAFIGGHGQFAFSPIFLFLVFRVGTPCEEEGTDNEHTQNARPGNLRSVV